MRWPANVFLIVFTSTALAQGPTPVSEPVSLPSTSVDALASGCTELEAILDSIDEATIELLHPLDDIYGWGLRDVVAGQRTRAYVNRIEANLRFILENEPTCPIPYLRLGDAFAPKWGSLWSSQVQLDSAIYYYDRGLSYIPHDPRLLIRRAWMHELQGQDSVAIAMYRQVGWIAELRVDGQIEAERLIRIPSLRESFYQEGSRSFISVSVIPFSYRYDSANYQEIAPYWYSEYRATGFHRFAYPNGVLNGTYGATRRVDATLLDRLFTYLEKADFLRLRSLLQADTNLFVDQMQTHSDWTKIQIHTPLITHTVIVDGLDYDSSVSESLDRDKSLTERFNALALLQKEALSTDWLATMLDEQYGTVRPFWHDDGTVRFNDVTNTATRVTVCKLDTMWQTRIEVPNALPSSGHVCASDSSYSYLFDVRDTVFAFCSHEGALLYRLPLRKAEWPWLYTYGGCCVYAGWSDGDRARVACYDLRTGKLLVRSELGPNDYYNELRVDSRSADVWDATSVRMKQECVNVRAKGSGNRPARHKWPTWGHD